MSNDEKTSSLYVARVCVVAALGGLLFGYDTGVIAGAIGFLETHFNLDPSFQKGWVAASALIGCTIGVSIAGLLSDWLGRKRIPPMIRKAPAIPIRVITQESRYRFTRYHQSLCISIRFNV